MRRPDYVPRDAVYVSNNRTKRRHGERRRMAGRIIAVILGLIAVAVACVALWRIGEIHDQERAGWPMVVTPSPYGPPAACHGLRAGCVRG